MTLTSLWPAASCAIYNDSAYMFICLPCHPTETSNFSRTPSARGYFIVLSWSNEWWDGQVLLYPAPRKFPWKKSWCCPVHLFTSTHSNFCTTTNHTCICYSIVFFYSKIFEGILLAKFYYLRIYKFSHRWWNFCGNYVKICAEFAPNFWLLNYFFGHCRELLSTELLSSLPA